MHAEPPLHPLLYAREVETPNPDDRRAALSGVQAESHVLLNAILIVEPDLPAALRQGMFATEARYPVIMRYAAGPADAPRGLALKVYGVIGDRLPGAEGLTQDFVMAARPRDPRVVHLDGAAETHILGDSFFGQTLIRFGDHVARIGIVPVSPGLTALTGEPLTPTGRPTALRDSVVEFFANHRAEWELRVQLGADIEDMSPDLTVARIRAEPQRAWIQSRAEPDGEALSFSPWHGLVAHRPLGSTRREAVQEPANFRRRVAGEARSFSPLADD